MCVQMEQLSRKIPKSIGVLLGRSASGAQDPEKKLVENPNAGLSGLFMVFLAIKLPWYGRQKTKQSTTFLDPYSVVKGFLCW